MSARENKLSESKHRLLRMGPLTEEAGTGAYCVIHRFVIPSNTNSLFIKVNVDSRIRRFIDFLQCLKGGQGSCRAFWVRRRASYPPRVLIASGCLFRPPERLPIKVVNPPEPYVLY